MPVKEGEFVKIEYTGRLSDGSVFDTTDEEIAKKEGVFSDKVKYRPALLIIGKGQAVKGLEEAAVGMEINEEKKVSVPPEKGFGQKDPNLINVVPISRFAQEKINPAPGLIVSINGKDAMIKSISGGRVVVDFNHPLAGQELSYEIKLVGVLKLPKEKIEALYEESGLVGSVEAKENEVVLNIVADQSFEFVAKKHTFLSWIADLILEIKKIKVNEEYEVEETEKGRKIKAIS